MFDKGNEVDSDFISIRSGGISYRNQNYLVTTKNIDRYLFEHIVRGSGFIECCGKLYFVSEGDYIIIRAGYPVKYYSNPRDPYIKLWFTAKGRFVDTLCDMYIKDVPVYVCKADVYNCFESFIAELAENPYTDTAPHRVLDIVYGMFEKRHDSEPEKTSPDSVAEKTRSYIDLFYRENITVASIAEHFGVSQRYLIEQFKQKYKTTIHKYVKQKKLETAYDLMTCTSYTISEISEMLGFCEPGYLTKSFKAEYGKSPAQVRREARSEK